jgi:hypothetical protein
MSVLGFFLRRSINRLLLTSQNKTKYTNSSSKHVVIRHHDHYSVSLPLIKTFSLLFYCSRSRSRAQSESHSRRPKSEPRHVPVATWTQFEVQDWLRGLHIDDKDLHSLTCLDGPLRNGMFAMKATSQNVADAFGRRANEQTVRVVQEALQALQRSIPRNR